MSRQGGYVYIIRMYLWPLREYSLTKQVLVESQVLISCTHRGTSWGAWKYTERTLSPAITVDTVQRWSPVPLGENLSTHLRHVLHQNL